MPGPITADEIADAARAPAETEIDGNRTKARPISELIEAQAAPAADKPGRGLRFTKLVPPGTI